MKNAGQIMRFTIWRVSPGGSAFQITTAGATSVKERALEKAQMFNERLLASEPDSEDRFVVRDNAHLGQPELRPMTRDPPI